MIKNDLKTMLEKKEIKEKKKILKVSISMDSSYYDLFLKLSKDLDRSLSKTAGIVLESALDQYYKDKDKKVL